MQFLAAMMFKKMKSVKMIHVQLMMGMKTNANTLSGHHSLSAIIKRKPSYDHPSKNCRMNYESYYMNHLL